MYIRFIPSEAKLEMFFRKLEIRALQFIAELLNFTPGLQNRGSRDHWMTSSPPLIPPIRL